VLAANTPSLGAAASYGLLANTYTNSAAGTTVNGDVGFLVAPGVEPAPVGGHTNYGSSPPYATAGADQATALSALNAEACTVNYPGAVVLSGTLAPGVYCAVGAMAVNTTLTLSGSGTYIFRSAGAFDMVAGAVITLTGGASACDVFWTPHATTFGAGASFVGTLIDNDAVTSGAGTSILGRILAFNGPVTTATTTINPPNCTSGSITVIKQVINDNGRTNTAADFPLFVGGTPVTSGATNTYAAPATYAVTETTDSGYAQSFSGDCDAFGNIALAPGDIAVCTITNDDIGVPIIIPPVPPIISVVKVPNPLNLPAGPGLVAYTFTLANIGTVTATNLTVVDDTCAPAVLVSGDINSNAQLETTETWTYTCSRVVSATHTNTVIATGLANGITATDIAFATVVVGLPAIVPPLIHVTKVPNPLTLPYGGGPVTYTETITNPGTAPLTGVTLTDDKCAPLIFVSGDTNTNSQLDVGEAWTYICQATLAATTTNTATVTGQAGGLIAIDFAIVTAIVATAAPGLPNTGVTSSF
jgi:uncharacterized repeat protein (TIGR01451 family)